MDVSPENVKITVKYTPFDGTSTNWCFCPALPHLPTCPLSSPPAPAVCPTCGRCPTCGWQAPVAPVFTC